MRALTMMQAQWRAEMQTGESLTFERCKGGYFSDREEYGLRVVGRTEQRTLTGKNLFNIDSPDIVNAYELNTKGELTSASIYSTSPYIPIRTSPAISLYCSNALNGTGYICAYDENYDFVQLMGGISHNQGRNTGTIYSDWPDNAAYVRFSYKTEAYEIQVEPGTTATAYEPYCGGVPAPNPDYPQPIQCVKVGTVITCGESEITTPCNLYEGDIWYPATGKVERHSAIVRFDGTEAWNHSAEYRCMITKRVHAAGIKKTIYCNRSRGELGLTFSNDRCTQLQFGSKTNPIDTDWGAGSVEAWNALLAGYAAAGDPLIVTYRLATPTLEYYTPQPLPAPAGTVTVEQAPADLAGTLGGTMPVRR